MDIDVQIEGDKDKQIDVNIYRQTTPTGKLSSRFTGYVSHKGLGVDRKFVDSDPIELKIRLENQATKWVQEWTILKKNKTSKDEVKKIKRILHDGVIKEIALDWERVKDYSLFSKEKPEFKELKPKLEETSPKPRLLDKLIKSRLIKVLEKQEQNFKKTLDLWNEKKKSHEKEIKVWEKEKKEFEERQKKYNKNVEDTIKDYKKSKPKAIEKHSQILLKQSEYPLVFNKKIAVEYKSDDKLLIVEYFLPSIEDFPKVKEIKYYKSTREKKEVPFSNREFKEIYNSTLYQITLRTIYELFKTDLSNSINNIVFNGYVNNLNKATGKRQNVCILSLMVNKDEFMDINFKRVDPKSCFKRFKGVSASELSVLTAIPPILKIDKRDKRFIEEQVVAEKLDDSANIAAMDWQDFEHLIREVFEREYSSIGGEVKVTQSSRDLGVDAVAFDPDPIRGGKVIIQAKRYTNTVHIESVRALYGIMQDEGAMKGILVTTSDFGSDAYQFSKNKPISLINGGNLLSMLHRHGYKGKIDIKEAKKILNEEQ